MSRKKTSGICAHCGNQRILTLEHLPPKGLFPKPRPTPLPIYTCEECNRGSSSLDEELKVLVGVAAYVREKPETKALWFEVVRTLRHNERLRKELIERISNVESDGSYRIRYTPEPLNPLVLKMARCLHFHHFKFHPPENAEIRISWDNKRFLVEDLQPDLGGGDVGSIDRFAYGYGLIKEYPEHYGAVIQFVFYRVLVATLIFTEAEQDAALNSGTASLRE